MDNNSWIKLFRKFREWEWYGDSNVSRVFLELLLTANFEDKNWRGIEIKRGQTIIGRKELSKILGISEQCIRTSLTKLKSTSEITSKSYNHFTVVTINKFNDYQELTSKSTSNQPATNQQLTTPKEYKKERNKEVIHISKKLYEGKTLELIGEKVIEAFNFYLGTKFKDTKSFLGGLEKWLGVYSLSDIEEAIKSIKYDSFWNGKMTPVILFRKKNPQGEPVDYIGQLLNSKKENHDRARNN